MYILNENEKRILKVMVKNARVDYFRKNKHLFNEVTIEDKVLCSKEEFEEEIAERNDSNIQAEMLERVFSEPNMSKIAKKVLTYNEKLVLFLYFVEGKTDEVISEILDVNRSTITKRRNNALEKLREKYMNGGNENV